MEKRKICGFSLVEAMSMLLITSIIIAVFAPIITSHLKSQDSGLGIGDNRCARRWADCMYCTMTECTACTKHCDAKKYMRISDCSCQDCATNCEDCVAESCLRCTRGYYPNGTGCTICEAGKYCDGLTGQKDPGTGFCVSKDGATCNTGTGSTMKIPKI